MEVNRKKKLYLVVEHQPVLMMDIDTDHFDDVHHEEMKQVMYVEIVIVHYHLTYHHLIFDHLDDGYYDEFSFYYLVLLFAIHHPTKNKIIKIVCGILILPQNLLLVFELLYFAYYDHIHERQGL